MKTVFKVAGFLVMDGDGSVVEDENPFKSPEKKRRFTSFQSSWKSSFDWIAESRRGPQHVTCKICGCDFTISHGGRHDIQRHASSEKHRQNSKHVLYVRSTQGHDEQNSCATKVTAAETAFVSMIAEHNLSFTCGEHILKFIKKHCADPEVVKKISCGGTKAACIARDVMGPKYQNDVVAMCRKLPFCVYLDKNMDWGEEKLLVILVGFFDVDLEKNVIRFLDMPRCVSETSQAVFDCLMETMRKFSVPAGNLVAFSSENDASMIGPEDSVLSRLKSLSPGIVNLGGVCHLAEICSNIGVESLSAPLAELVSDIHSYFSSSAHKQHQLKTLGVLVDLELLKTIKCAPVRWLHLNKVIKHVSDLWPALLPYFINCESRASKVELIRERLQNQELRLVFLYLQFALQPLCQFHSKLQNRDSRLVTLHEYVNRIIQLYAGRLLKPEAASKFLAERDLSLLDDADSMLQNEETCLGSEVGEYLRVHAGSLTGTDTEKNIYKKAALLCTAVLKKMLQNSAEHYSLLKNAGVFLNPDSKLKLSGKLAVDLASQVGMCLTGEEEYQLLDEFSVYQLSDTIDVKTESNPHVNDTNACVVKYWGTVLKEICRSEGELPIFKKLIQVLLCLPHSHAEPQRAFSIIQKVKAEVRHCLTLKALIGLLSIKINEDRECFEVQYPTEIMEAAKKATSVYNKEHKSLK
ncbi:hypothetical protein AOXY_G16278 [Acipenser oxyrinchus oxyrinchus]|uniref:Uncharacterized protein n=1 Tax=Acipenser oxyrinchus oxyrinchus TaxID=40147 RepID=A0AAD8G414_ACIOX|nr:hypothetical protein AOXY_G16278 [Acipenser oxyrinchus oxyrinchus]